MTGPVDVAGFFVLGLFGGLGHCVGMCAPFVFYVSSRFGGSPDGGRRTRLAIVRPQLAYGLGRTLTYALLGAAAGLVGSAVDFGGAMLGVQRGAAIVAGAVLVVYAVGALFALFPVLPRGGGGIFGRIGAFLGRRPPRHPFVTGLLLGLLPCGLLYSALIGATAAGGPARGALWLAAFGLGTIPALLGLAVLGDLLVRGRTVLSALSLVFVLAMGLWFVWQGLGV